MDSRRYQHDVEKHGFSATHQQAIDWVPSGARVLELGCASGYIGRRLIREKGCQVTGIEIDKPAAAEARAAGLTVIEGSLEDESFRASIGERFDAILATDVLEHLRDPAAVLNHFKSWLLPTGRAIVAVPNVATWSMRWQLFFRGDFTYQETGILDRTHVHMFTWDTFHALIREQGWRIEATMCEGQEIPVLHGPLVGWPRRLRSELQGEPRHSGFNVSSAGWIQRAARAAGDAYIGAASAIADGIIARWPNLCVSHMAMVIVPST
jgi:methionine biosynthesis protein MetW